MAAPPNLFSPDNVRFQKLSILVNTAGRDLALECLLYKHGSAELEVIRREIERKVLLVTSEAERKSYQFSWIFRDDKLISLNQLDITSLNYLIEILNRPIRELVRRWLERKPGGQQQLHTDIDTLQPVAEKDKLFAEVFPDGHVVDAKTLKKDIKKWELLIDRLAESRHIVLTCLQHKPALLKEGKLKQVTPGGLTVITNIKELHSLLDMRKLKTLRNDIQHAVEQSLKQDEFDRKFGEAKQAFLDLVVKSGFSLARKEEWKNRIDAIYNLKDINETIEWFRRRNKNERLVYSRHIKSPEDIITLSMTQRELPENVTDYRIIKTNMKPTEMFNEYDDTVLRILEGHPGAGKTCLSVQTAYFWADNKGFLDFNLVLLVYLRFLLCEDLAGMNDFKYSFVLNYLRRRVGLQCEYVDVVKHLLQSIDHRTLVILDGIDELSNDVRDEITDFFVDHPVLPNNYVLGTSRPYGVEVILRETKVLHTRYVLEELATWKQRETILRVSCPGKEHRFSSFFKEVTMLGNDPNKQYILHAVNYALPLIQLFELYVKFGRLFITNQRQARDLMCNYDINMFLKKQFPFDKKGVTEHDAKNKFRRFIHFLGRTALQLVLSGKKTYWMSDDERQHIGEDVLQFSTLFLQDKLVRQDTQVIFDDIVIMLQHIHRSHVDYLSGCYVSYLLLNEPGPEDPNSPYEPTADDLGFLSDWETIFRLQETLKFALCPPAQCVQLGEDDEPFRESLNVLSRFMSWSAELPNNKYMITFLELVMTACDKDLPAELLTQFLQKCIAVPDCYEMNYEGRYFLSFLQLVYSGCDGDISDDIINLMDGKTSHISKIRLKNEDSHLVPLLGHLMVTHLPNLTEVFISPCPNLALMLVDLLSAVGTDFVKLWIRTDALQVVLKLPPTGESCQEVEVNVPLPDGVRELPNLHAVMKDLADLVENRKISIKELDIWEITKSDLPQPGLMLDFWWRNVQVVRLWNTTMCHLFSPLLEYKMEVPWTKLALWGTVDDQSIINELRNSGIISEKCEVEVECDSGKYQTLSWLKRTQRFNWPTIGNDLKPQLEHKKCAIS